MAGGIIKKSKYLNHLANDDDVPTSPVGGKQLAREIAKRAAGNAWGAEGNVKDNAKLGRVLYTADEKGNSTTRCWIGYIYACDKKVVDSAVSDVPGRAI